MYRHLPNQLTLLRLLLAGVFFITLNQYRYESLDVTQGLWLWASAAVFILAALTDALDGYLARKWHVESAFGRIMDPFCDKVLVLGAFIYLAGPGFAVRTETDAIISVSGVYPWMVAVMLARELLVTGVRGELEGSGVQFGANVFGKVKMILQSCAVPIILVAVWLDPLHPQRTWLHWVLLTMAYALVAITLISGLPYISQAGKAMKGETPST